jgi:hypothetical protein
MAVGRNASAQRTNAITGNAYVSTEERAAERTTASSDGDSCYGKNKHGGGRISVLAGFTRYYVVYIADKEVEVMAARADNPHARPQGRQTPCQR